MQDRRPARPVRIAATARVFRTRLKKKTPAQREQVKAAIEQMEANLNYPALRVRPIESQPGVWEARASNSLRLSFEFLDAQSIRLRVNCTHDQVYGRG